jgi:protease secretion system membrane fusion protein
MEQKYQYNNDKTWQIAMKLNDLFKSRAQQEDTVEKQALPDKYSDTRKPVRIGIIILIVGFGGFLLWAGFAPLDEGVPCQGLVSIATKRKVVQNRQGGVVDSVLVHEGQIVKKDQPLILLDRQTAKARYAEVHQRYLSQRAAEGRLQAEQAGRETISFHPDLISDPDHQLTEQLMRNQRELLQSRIRTVRILKEQLAGVSQLVKEGYAPLSQQRELEIKIAQHKEESSAQLAQVQNEVQSDAEKSKALYNELVETEIKSPSEGQVVGLQVQTVGAVIQPGQKIMDIVPSNEGLLIEAKIAPHLIDKVHAGLLANVSFASFANSPQLVVSGKVESVSGDLITDMQTGNAPAQPYFLARIAVTSEGTKMLGQHKLQPGMPVQVIIKTGERSLLTYIMHPLMKRMSASLKEE